MTWNSLKGPCRILRRPRSGRGILRSGCKCTWWLPPSRRAQQLQRIADNLEGNIEGTFVHQLANDVSDLQESIAAIATVLAVPA